MVGGVGHTGGLTNPHPGAEDAESVILIPEGAFLKKLKVGGSSPVTLFFSFNQENWVSVRLMVPIPVVCIDQTEHCNSSYGIKLGEGRLVLVNDKVRLCWY